MSDIQLRKEDLEGASLKERLPNQLIVRELKFCLSCRAVTKLNTKAELAAKYDTLLRQHMWHALICNVRIPAVWGPTVYVTPPGVFSFLIFILVSVTLIIASNTSSNWTFLPVKVHQLIENGDHKNVIDPTPDKLYLKKHAADGGGAHTQETQSTTNTVYKVFLKVAGERTCPFCPLLMI